MSQNNVRQFLDYISQNIETKEFVKLTISKKRFKNNELKSVIASPVIINSGNRISFVYRYPTNDITKNFDIKESLNKIEELIVKDFLQADLFTLNADWHLMINKNNNSKIIKKSASNIEKPTLSHDKIKKRLISTNNNIYLRELGITTNDGVVRIDMNDKFKQINKYIEIIDSILKTEKINENISIADMGSGKGYLTFALYDHLSNNLKLNPNITGIEFRKELVDKCNVIAKKTKFDNLKFQEGSIEKAKLSNVEMLIALHACDTATDEAIYRGIKERSQIIICAPCCHHQIRTQIKPENELQEITKHGILAERQSEIITDTIRALILEAYGYKTKVFEFISTEHTPKNILIVATKKPKTKTIDPGILKQIKGIKLLYGIEFHYLEKLLNI